MTSIARNGAVLTIAVSGVVGFWIGIRCFPTWHVAVETAQVVAGIVRYPPDNPFYIYHRKLWTVMHEVLAVLLRAGVSEIALSRLMSGLLGMISLQALAACVYALSSDAAYAVACSIVIFLGGAGEFSGTYPIDLMGTTHTYGAIGLSSIVLAAGLLGSGAYRAGGLLLGFMPAIHPSIGIWGGTIAAICLLTGWGRFSREFRPALPWFLGGCALTVTSLAVHLWLARGIAPAAVDANRYLDAYVQLWDVHRRAPNIHDLTPYLYNPAVRLAFGVVPLATVWRWTQGDRIRPSADFLIRFVVAAACVAIVAMLVSLATGGWLPSVVQILMPLRVLNIVGMMSAAVLFGAIVTSDSGATQWLAVLLGAGLLIGDRSKLGIDRSRHSWMPQELSPLTVVAVIAIALIAYAAYRRRQGVSATEPARGRARAMLASVGAVCLLAYWAPSSIQTEPLPMAFRDWRHDPVFSAAAAGQGLLATGDSLHLIQLKTRRPVLLDGGGIDGIVYSIDAAPAMERIVREVYGIDMFHPTAEEHTGAEPISAIVNQRNWQQYSRAKWTGIRRAFGVTQVLTPAGWQLDLPVVIASDELTLYEIPETQ